VRTDEHNFIAQDRINPWYLRQDVIAVAVVFVEARTNFDLELDLHSGLHHANKHVVVFRREHDRGYGAIWRGAATLHSHRSVLHCAWL
jgi:hypothetical protein